MKRNCKWCGEEVNYPAKAHVSPPCDKAPPHIKNKWSKEKPERDRIDKSFEVITRLASGKK